jgi:hypothetical protein
MTIEAGDLVLYLGKEKYLVEEVSNDGYVTCVTQQSTQRRLPCHVTFHDFTILKKGPNSLTPKERVCLKVKQLNEKFEKRKEYKATQEESALEIETRNRENTERMNRILEQIRRDTAMRAGATWTVDTF